MNNNLADDIRNEIVELFKKYGINEGVMIFDYSPIPDSPAGGTGLVHAAVRRPTTAYLTIAMQINVQIQEMQRLQTAKENLRRASKN